MGGLTKIIAITKSDIDLGFKMESLVTTDFDVLILDRYDLYEGREIYDIYKTHPNSYILIDCKIGFSQWIIGTDFFDEYAEVEFTPKEIKVS